MLIVRHISIGPHGKKCHVDEDDPRKIILKYIMCTAGYERNQIRILAVSDVPCIGLLDIRCDMKHIDDRKSV